MRARLYLASWPSRGVVSQRSSSASYHAALPCLPLSHSLYPSFFSFSRVYLAFRVSRSVYIYLRLRAVIRIAVQNSALFHRDRPLCNARRASHRERRGSSSSLSIERRGTNIGVSPECPKMLSGQ